MADTLGWIYVKSKHYAQGIALLKESVEKLPTNPMPLYHLGMAYLGQGDRAAAKRALARALELDAGFAGADAAREALRSL